MNTQMLLLIIDFFTRVLVVTLGVMIAIFTTVYAATPLIDTLIAMHTVCR